MKINEQELQQIIKEETARLKTRMMLEAERKAILKRLHSLDECDMMEAGHPEEMEEGLGDMMKNAGQKIGQFMGTKWSQQQAEQAFMQSYAKSLPKLAQQLNANPEVLKAALIKFMMEIGGLAILGGNGQNAIWNAAQNEFTRKTSGIGGGGNFHTS